MKSCIIKYASVLVFLLFVQLSYAQPNAVSGLSLWLKSDFGIVLTGTNVSQWLDASSNGNNCSQVSSGFKPTLAVPNATINNHQSVIFDGIDDYMEFTSRLTDIRTVFFVFKHANGNGTTLYQPILGDSQTYDFIGDGSVGDKIFDPSITSPFILNGNVKLNTVSAPLVSNVKKPIQFSILSITTTGNVSADRITRDRANVNRVWDGEYCEIIIYNKVLNSIEISDIEKYLVTKYAPVLDLGSDIEIQPANGCVPSNSIIIQANPNFKNYLWNDGSITNQISVNQYGKYSVITTDIFDIKHYDTVNVIPIKKDFHYISNILCKNTMLVWNTLLNKTDYTFTWQDNSTDSLIVITQPGSYSVTINDGFGCSYVSNTTVITEDDFPTTTTLGSDASICAGNSIALQTNTNSAITYTWNDGSHQPSLMVNSSGQYFLAVTNTNNCLAKDTIQITVVGQAPSVNFDFSVGCKNSLVTFTNMSIAPSGNNITSSFWNFGNASSSTNTSSATNPNHTFADTGNYTVYLNVITDAGCNNSISKLIHVAPTPTVNFVYSTPCQNDSIQFSSIVSSPTYSVFSRAWNFGDASSGINNISLLTSPKHLFNNNLTYTVKHIATNNAGCKDSISKSVLIRSQVKADFTYSLACTNELVKFKDSSIVPNPNTSNVRNWNFGGATATGTLINYFYPIAGVYSVSLSVIGNNGCSSTAVKQVTVTGSPSSNFIAPSGFCKSDSILLTDGSSGSSSITNWRWTSDNIFTSSFSSFYYKNLISGNHTIQLKVINSSGCKDSISKIITVNNLPIVSFTTFPSDVFSGTTATLTPTTNSNTVSTYTWSDGVGFYSNLSTPIYVFSDTGMYHILLQMKDVNGCKNAKQSTIYVLNKRSDLAILDVSTIIKDDGYLDIIAHLANFGNSTINQFKIKITVLNSSTIKEQWIGDFNKSSLLDFHFQSKILANDPLKNNVICLEITEVNSSIDDNVTNNTFCKDVTSKGNFVYEPYPSPTNGDLTFPISLKQNENVDIEIINMLGEIVFTTSIDANEGFNSIPVSVKNMGSGCYISKITIDGHTSLKKITKE